MNVKDYEWQMHSENEWWFGPKIRGIVRFPIAEVYFDDELSYPWKWMVGMNGALLEIKTGFSNKIDWAIIACERELGLIEFEKPIYKDV